MKFRRRFYTSAGKCVTKRCDRSASGSHLTSAQLAMLTRDNIAALDAVEKVFGFKPASLRERIDDVLH